MTEHAGLRREAVAKTYGCVTAAEIIVFEVIDRWRGENGLSKYAVTAIARQVIIELRDADMLGSQLAERMRTLANLMGTRADMYEGTNDDPGSRACETAYRTAAQEIRDEVARGNH